MRSSTAGVRRDDICVIRRGLPRVRPQPGQDVPASHEHLAIRESDQHARAIPDAPLGIRSQIARRSDFAGHDGGDDACREVNGIHAPDGLAAPLIRLVSPTRRGCVHPAGRPATHAPNRRAQASGWRPCRRVDR